jgi:hypothetical protein
VSRARATTENLSQKKRFFFEKRSKKLLRLCCDNRARVRYLARRQTDKVFWFFFSKKNALRSLAAR